MNAVRHSLRLRARLAFTVFALCAGSAALPAAASAATAVSSNWAGYAITGKTFRRVTGTWIVSRGTCTRGNPTFSADWIGLGGFSISSQALEQTGTEFDCGSGGRAHYSAWYELLPAPPVTVNMAVRPGDKISAIVDVRRSHVTITLRNRTTGKRVVKRLRMSHPDLSSAEWIVEAPSACDSTGRCIELPLSDFGSVSFLNATATTARGRTGTISDPNWSATEIRLVSNTTQNGFVGNTAQAAALPSALSVRGDSFLVTFARGVTSARRVSAAALRAGQTPRRMGPPPA